MSSNERTLRAVAHQIAARLPSAGHSPLVAGLCGAQGSGKSTLAAALAVHFASIGVPTAILSIDDLYRTKADREALARDIHPLLRTRGVPGTHDLGLGMAVFASLDRHRPTSLPRFDKASDDRVSEVEWPLAPEEPRLVIFEGWCVGARAQASADLDEPINSMERIDDPHGTWRRYVNVMLATEYRRLFERLDFQVLLAAPDFAIVEAWRMEQERELRRRVGAGMADAEIKRFIAHYERLTRHILAEMPGRADLVVRLNDTRAPIEIIAH